MVTARQLMPGKAGGRVEGLALLGAVRSPCSPPWMRWPGGRPVSLRAALLGIVAATDLFEGDEVETVGVGGGGELL